MGKTAQNEFGIQLGPARTMKPLAPQPNRTERVYQAIVDAICEGQLEAGTHLVQDQLAEQLGVSRQPIQQAMALLKADGLVEEVGRRGMQVATLNLALMRQHYDIRGVLDGLAARSAARQAANDRNIAAELERRGRAILIAGEDAMHQGNVSDQLRHDVAFHQLFYEFSGNPLIERDASSHWRFLRRAMGEILRLDELPEIIWKQHSDILQAVTTGRAKQAEKLAVNHVETVADVFEGAAEDVAN